jgi:dTDP-glucose 4,6-dehydratase
MLHQALHGNSIPVHIGAERSWCYVTDTVRGLRLTLEDAVPGVFNVGRDDAAVPMSYVAELACEITDADPSLIELIPAPEMQTVVKRLSTERLRALGWEPEVDLIEGMQRTLEWVKNLDAKGAVAV